MIVKLCCVILLVCHAAQASTFSDLTLQEQEKVKQGELVSIPVSIQGNLFRGTFFKYLKGISPVQPAAVWFDYNNQFKFVPGMTYTRALRWKGKKAYVRHHINGAIFLTPELERATPFQISEAFSYVYDLDEEVFLDSGTYTIQWSIPKEVRTLGSNEKGWIEFRPYEEGTLITYENATTPPLFGIIKNLPFIVDAMCSVPQRYYHDTITYLVDRLYRVIESGELISEIDSLNQIFATSPKEVPTNPEVRQEK